MSETLVISIDAMGGDNAPQSVIEGVSRVIKKDSDTFFFLFGDEEKEEALKKFGGKTLTKVPELSEFLRSEEHLRLGTNARIPVPLELNGNPVKVFVRPLSRKELIECRNKAENKGHGDVDYEAILMTCTDSNGTPYTEKDLEIFGYGHMQTIAEAIIIASGESPENTQTALRDRLIDEFLEKFTPKT